MRDEPLQPVDPVPYEDWVKVVPHPPLGWQVEIDPREGRSQLLVELVLPWGVIFASGPTSIGGAV